MTFEHNRCVGAVQGSRLYLKYAYHFYQAWNTELVTWGGDREGMTYDNPGRSFAGRFVAAAASEASEGRPGGASVVKLSPTDTAKAFSRYDDTSDGNQHVMVLIEGTAAGQWRWVVAYAGEGEFVLDRPFDVEPDSDALMVVDVAKAQNIHFRNTLKDVGNFQFFGSVIDTDVVENVGERMGGFFSWGQLHGNATFIGPQNLSTPDLYVQWLGNEVIEGNTCRNYRKQMAEVTPGWGEWGFNGFTFAVIADPQKLVNGRSVFPSFSAIFNRKMQKLPLFSCISLRNEGKNGQRP